MAQYEDITIDQGTDFAMELYLINKDQSVKNLSNHTVAGKLKKTYNSDSSDTHDFAVTIATPTDGVATLSYRASGLANVAAFKASAVAAFRPATPSRACDARFQAMVHMPYC